MPAADKPESDLDTQPPHRRDPMTSALFILASLLAMLVPATAAGAIAPGHTIGQYLYESEALLKQTIAEGPYGGVSICAGHGVPCHYSWFYKELGIPNEDTPVDI